jgi:hypothetical protein
MIGRMDRENPAAATAKALESTFPGITIDYRLNDKDEAFWAKYLQKDGEPVTLGKFITLLLEDFLSASVRSGVNVMFLSEATGGTDESRGIRVRVAATVPLVASDKRPFSLNLAYLTEAGKLKLYLETVVAPTQGRKFAKVCLLPQARIFNAAKIGLKASSIGGSQEGVFVWARYGFVPLKPDWEKMRRFGLSRLEEEGQGKLAPVSKSLGADLLDPSPKALRRVVYLSWTVPKALKEPMKAFLDNMLTFSVSWDGELLLADQAGSAWIEAYADSAPNETFTPLLPEISGKQEPEALEQVPASLDSEESGAEDNNPFDMTEEQAIVQLADSIHKGLSSVEDVQKEYPELTERVLEKLKQYE